MGEWVAYILSVGLLFVAVTFGFSLVEAQGAQAQLTRVAQLAANAMSVDGGFTQPIQQAVVQQLQADGFNPVVTVITLTPDGVRAAYGQMVAIRIVYPVPIRIVDIAPFTVAVSGSAAAVSLYVPGSPASANAVLSAPGQGTGDFWQPVPASGQAVWVGP